MNFAAPLALAWLALAIPIVIFYILKIRLRQAPVSTTIFWRKIYDEKRPRSLWQQFRHWLSLLVQLCILALLAFALAEPFLNSDKLRQRRVVLVIDNSTSMNATDVTPTRLDQARRSARDLVRRMRFRDEMAIVSAGGQPQVICGLTSHERTLLAAVDALPRADGPTSVSQAVELGKLLLTGYPRGEVVVVSDGGFEESEKLANDSRVHLVPVGTKTDNLGLTNFQVRRALADPVGYEILVEVTNASEQPAQCRLDIDLNDAPVDVIPLNLAAGETWRRTLEKTSIDGGRLVAKLDHADALAADNRAFAILPKRQLQRVVLVTEGNLFLQKAIEANPLVQLEVLKESPKTYEAGAVYIFHRATPEKLPPGYTFVVDPTNACDLWTTGEPLENPIVAKQDSDSPLMRHVRLDNVELPQARKLTPIGAAHVLAGAVTGEPLYFSIEQTGSKILVLSVNLDQGDLTFRTAFPIMMTNALTWFAGQSAELRESYPAGKVVDVELPKVPTKLALYSPSKVSRELPSAVSKIPVGPLDEVGVWTVAARSPAGASATTTNEPATELACNLASQRESDLRPPEAWTSGASRELASAGWFVRPIWFYLIALAWLALFLEWIGYQRRVID